MADYVTAGLERWRARMYAPLLVVAIGSLPILLLEVERRQLGRGDRLFIDVVNVVVLVVFAIDYVVELRLARHRASFVRGEWPNLLIVVAQVLALVPGLASFGVLRILRAGRAARALAAVLRVIALGRIASRDGRRLLRDHAGGLAIGVAGLTWLTSAAAFTLVEDVGTDGRLTSFFDALWWSSATITTVGYGDVYPVTGAGRLVGGFTMFIGISTFAVITAKVAEFLVRAGADDAAAAEGDTMRS